MGRKAKNYRLPIQMGRCRRLTTTEGSETRKAKELHPALSLLLPATGLGLLPVGHGVACRLVSLPAVARVGDGGVVPAVEQFEAALVIADLLRLRPIGHEEEGRAVRILVEVSEP